MIPFTKNSIARPTDGLRRPFGQSVAMKVGLVPARFWRNVIVNVELVSLLLERRNVKYPLEFSFTEPNVSVRRASVTLGYLSLTDFLVNFTADPVNLLADVFVILTPNKCPSAWWMI